MTAQQELRPLELPAAWTPAWCAEAAGALDAASRAGPAALKAVLPQEVVCGLLERCHQLLQGEPTLLEVWPKAEGQVPAVARPALLLLLGASFWLTQPVRHWYNTGSSSLLLGASPPLPRCPLCLPTRCMCAGGAARGLASGGCGRHARPVSRRLPHVSRAGHACACLLA